MPDRLEPFERFDLPARTVRPVWLSIDIPANAKPGDYSGSIQVHSSTERATLQVRIHVQQPTLPEPRDWKFRLDLWQNPWVVASYFQVEPWSEEHKALLRKHLKLYAEAGGKYITTYTVHSPWSDNSYVLEGTMIGWLKTTAGAWKFDYSIFDQYVELAMEAGVDEAITIYTPIPWGHRFRYLDEKSGNFIYEEWSPKSAAVQGVLERVSGRPEGAFEEERWFEKTYLGINENPLDLTLAAAKVIKEHSKEWKITYAGDWHAELSSLLDDYSVIITQEPGAEGVAGADSRRIHHHLLRLLQSASAEQLRILCAGGGQVHRLVCRGLRVQRVLALGLRRLAGGPDARCAAHPLAGGRLLSGVPGRKQQHPVRKAPRRHRRL